MKLKLGKGNTFICFNYDNVSSRPVVLDYSGFMYERVLSVRRKRTALSLPFLIVIVLLLCPSRTSQAQEVVDLSLESAVEMALGNSYRVRQLQLGIEQSRRWLAAHRAGLKSRVYMNVTTPEVAAISDNKWNSDLRKYEIVKENNRRWEMNLAVQQPVILFGWPTNGYLSLNNRMYRYMQLNGGKDLSYYNRYFISFQQPLFQPNNLKNQLEVAELDVDNVELDFQNNIIRLIDDISDDYYDLFELAYRRVIYEGQVRLLEEATPIARQLSESDTSRSIEVSLLQVEIANAREQQNQTASSYRLASSSMKQRLGLPEDVEIHINPVIDIRPIKVNVEQAIEYGRELRPQLRQLEISRRKDEIDVENARGWDSFRANLEATYGREVQDPHIGNLWSNPDNSYSIGLHAYVPIWDWGRRKARIEAEKIGLQKTELYIEEAEKEIQSNISNMVRNLEEYQSRALTMQKNLHMAEAIARETLQRYREGRITILDLLQSLKRQKDTAENFLTAYLGYQEALMSLATYTHYDFENDVPIAKRFEVMEEPSSL